MPDSVADLEASWRDLNHPPKDNGCIICGVGGEDVFIGDTPAETVKWRCQSCNRLVCRNHTLCIPDAKNLEPHYGGREYMYMTLCSLACWERVGRPEE